MRFVVDVKHLSVCFGDFYAVKDVSFSVSKGEIFGFLGANGAGKTTTIRVLCGLLLASSGTVLIDNEAFVAGKENIIKQKVGYMSQHFTLYNDLSIKENMDFAAALRHLGKKKYLQNRKKLLDFIDFKYDLSTVVKDLPDGIKQEIALCVSLLHDPLVVFLDEPTAGVAPVARARFWSLIKALAKTGKTIFVTTHYMDEAENCERIALMRSGELIALDSPENLKRQTFTGTMYNLTPKGDKPAELDKQLFDVLEPYGQHFHALFKAGVNERQALENIKKDYLIEQIAPSLEDVFIRKVEGQNR